MTTILLRMASGVPGQDTRPSNSTIEQGLMNASAPFSAFGLPGKMVNGLFVPVGANDLGESVFAWLVRAYPGGSPTQNDPLGTSTPSQTGGGCNKMRRGYMAVHCNAGVPAEGVQAYFRAANAGAGKPIGGVEAAAEYGVTGVAGANTGNGTIGTLSAVAGSTVGAFKVTMLTATTFRVEDPNGVRLKDGATGTAYTAAGVTFTITVGGTPMIAGDSFTVTNVANTVAIPRTFFAGAADAAGNAEISIRI